MSHTELRAPGVLHTVSPLDGGRRLSAISIGIGEAAGSTTRWRIRITVITSGGLAVLGQIRTALPVNRIPGRIVALASCPGVIGWQVWAEPVAPYSASEALGTLKVEAIDCCGSEPGVVPLDGSLLENGGPDAGAYNHAAGTAAAVVTIPDGATVDEWSCLANSVGPAFVDIETLERGPLPQITVPVGAGHGVEPRGLVGPATIEFSGDIATYFVRWREVA